MTRIAVVRHYFAAYGRLPSVWIGIIFTTLANVILSGCVALLVAQIVVATLESGEAHKWVLLLLVSLVVAILLIGIGDYVFVRGTDARYKDLVGRFYSELTQKDVDFFRGEKIGALHTLFRDYMDGTINVFRILRSDVVPALCAVLLPIFIFAAFDLKLAAVLAAGILLQVVISIVSARRVRPLREAAHKVYRELSGTMADHIVHLAVMRASGRIEESRARLEELADREAVLFWQRHAAVILFDCLKAIVGAVCMVGVFGILARSSRGDATFTRLAVLSAIYITQSMTFSHGYAEVVQRLAEHWGRVRSSLAVLAKQSRVMTWTRDTVGGGLLNGEVVFNAVSFSHRGGAADPTAVVFKDLNLVIPDGAHVALLGDSGAGKSTLAHLLLRFDDVTAGAITIGGLDLREIPEERLYRAISYVPQQPDLMNASISYNIRLFAPEASEGEIWEACRIACADEFIGNLDGGLSYEVGELGARLSGGQRQRIALARALLRDARLYVFDEITSALDEPTAETVILNLRAKLKNKTVILMAHSAQIAQMMDRALVVEDLRIQRGGFRGTGSLF